MRYIVSLGFGCPQDGEAFKTWIDEQGRELVAIDFPYSKNILDVHTPNPEAFEEVLELFRPYVIRVGQTT